MTGSEPAHVRMHVGQLVTHVQPFIWLIGER
jgi:hypothetical protein